MHCQPGTRSISYLSPRAACLWCVCSPRWAVPCSPTWGMDFMPLCTQPLSASAVRLALAPAPTIRVVTHAPLLIRHVLLLFLILLLLFTLALILFIPAALHALIILQPTHKTECACFSGAQGLGSGFGVRSGVGFLLLASQVILHVSPVCVCVCQSMGCAGAAQMPICLRAHHAHTEHTRAGCECWPSLLAHTHTHTQALRRGPLPYASEPSSSDAHIPVHCELTACTGQPLPIG